MITYIEGNLEKHWKEIIDLYRCMWYHTDFYKRTKLEFKPSKEIYDVLNTQGSLVSRLGYTDSGELAVVFVAAVTPHPYNMDVNYGQELLWFIHPKYRGKGYLKQLMTVIDEAMTLNNCYLWNLALSSEMGSGENTMNKYGYELYDKTFIKVREGN